MFQKNFTPGLKTRTGDNWKEKNGDPEGEERGGNSAELEARKIFYSSINVRGRRREQAYSVFRL